jgi:hypothetical protein
VAVWAAPAVLEKYQTKLVVTCLSAILDASAILAASTIFFGKSEKHQPLGFKQARFFAFGNL